jgi:hypothetical protein
MTRELLLGAVVLVGVTACASTHTPTPPPNAATVTGSATTNSPPPSSPSGITSQDAARIAPLAPPQLAAVAEAGSVRLTWPATGEDLAYYQCLRRTAPAGEWQPAGRTPPEQHTCLDRNPGNGTYIYGVQAIKSSGLASPITESQPITVG